MPFHRQSHTPDTRAQALNVAASQVSEHPNDACVELVETTGLRSTDWGSKWCAQVHNSQGAEGRSSAIPVCDTP